MVPMLRRMVFAIVLLLMVQPIFALSASIQPPKMVLRGEAPGSVSGFVDVKNPNNESITVNITAVGDIIHLVELSNESILLDSNETKRVDFVIDLVEKGNYTGEILFMFIPVEGQGIVLSSQIIVLATKKENGTAVDNDWTITGILLGIVIIAIILIYWWGRKR